MFYDAEKIVDRQRTYTEYFEKDGRQFSVKLFYDLGGMSYYTYKVSKRGYFISVTPCSYALDGVGISFMMFSGYKRQVMEANRFSKKIFAQLRDKYFNAENDSPAFETMEQLYLSVRRDFNE